MIWNTVFEWVKSLNSGNVWTRISISQAGPGVTGHAGVFTAGSSQALGAVREIRVQKGPHCSPPPDNHLSTGSHVTFSVQTSKVHLELELILPADAQLLPTAAYANYIQWMCAKIEYLPADFIRIIHLSTHFSEDKV